MANYTIGEATGTAEGGYTITNTCTYEAAATEVLLGVKKTLENAEKLADGREETFAFRLKQGETTVDTVEITLSKAAGEGSATFKALDFETAGTYEYTVTEEAVTADGITGDETVYTVKVDVTDDLTGQLKATATITKNGQTAEAIGFVNTYTHATTEVAVEKVWVETDAQKPLRPASCLLYTSPSPRD